MHAGLAAAGLACLAIPILIHLLMNRRRKPVRWGAMRFLLEAYRRQRKRLLVEKWLLLALRCLLLAVLGVALGRPIIGALSSAGSAPRPVYLLIDNSLTAGLKDHDGRMALDRHKRQAKDILQAIGDSRAGAGEPGASVVAGLIALGGPAEGIVLPASGELDAVARQVDAIELTDSRADLAGGLGVLAQALAAQQSGAMGGTGTQPAPPIVVVLSDFLEGTIDLSSPSTGGAALSAARVLPKGTRMIVSAPAEIAVNNTSILSAEPMRSVLIASQPGASAAEQVRVMLRRTGSGVSQAASSLVRAKFLSADPAPRPAARPDAPGGSSVADAAAIDEPKVVVRWSPGQDLASVSLTVATGRGSAGKGAGGVGGGGSAVLVATIDDDALSADNMYRRPVELRDALRVGIIAPKRIETAIRADKLDAATWLRLALLAPGSGRGGDSDAGIEVVEIDPASVESARLSALDALFLPRPDLIADSAWLRLRLFVDSGGMLVVSPPAGVQVHVWPDALTRTFDLDWTAAREAITPGAPAAGGRYGASEQKPNSGGDQAAPRMQPVVHGDESGSQGVLGLLAGELAELARAVSVHRVLAMQATKPDADPPGRDAILALDDGTPVLWAAPPPSPKTTVVHSPSPLPVSDEPPAGGDAPKASASRPQAAQGLLFYLATAIDLDWTDLPAKPLMVPLVQEVVRQGVGSARASYSCLAGVRPSAPARSTELVRIAEMDDRTAGDSADPRVGVVVGTGVSASAIRRAGVWRAVDDQGATRAILAVNPDAAAGRTPVQARQAVGAYLAGALVNSQGEDRVGVADQSITWLAQEGSIGAAAAGAEQSPARETSSAREAVASIVGESPQESRWSLPLLCAALLLAVIELALARRASHASVTDKRSSLSMIFGTGARAVGAGSIVGAPAAEEGGGAA